MGTLILILGILGFGVTALWLSTRHGDRIRRPNLRERNADEPLGNRIIERTQQILDRQ